MEPTSFNITIDPVIENTSFACDLHACKGACCTMPGGRGAPLLDEEVALAREVLPLVRARLSDEHAAVLDEIGPVEGSPGDYHTTCVDNRACAFVVFEGPIAHCSIEQAYVRGETTWRKPLSCHLFPVRLDRRPTPSLRFEYIAECAPALERGSAEGIPLVTFVSDALQRAFGPRWVALRERMSR